MTMLIRICGCDRCGASQRLEQLQCVSTPWVQTHDTRAALWLGNRDSMTRVVSVCDTCYQEIDRQGGERIAVQPRPGPMPPLGTNVAPKDRPFGRPKGAVRLYPVPPHLS